MLIDFLEKVWDGYAVALQRENDRLQILGVIHYDPNLQFLKRTWQILARVAGLEYKIFCVIKYNM